MLLHLRKSEERCCHEILRIRVSLLRDCVQQRFPYFYILNLTIPEQLIESVIDVQKKKRISDDLQDDFDTFEADIIYEETFYVPFQVPITESLK